MIWPVFEPLPVQYMYTALDMQTFIRNRAALEAEKNLIDLANRPNNLSLAGLQVNLYSKAFLVMLEHGFCHLQSMTSTEVY